jgi:hypothetical protein
MRPFVWKLTAVALILVTISCAKSSSDYEALVHRNIQCPEGSQLEYHPWGESGREAVCLLRNGPIAMAENGHIIIEGQYSMGKQVGEWRWLDASGKVVRIERYDGK